MRAKLMNPTSHSRFVPPAGRRHRPAVGSAYLVTLLALVVLTMLALSLSVVTQSEMLIGSNERTIQRVFYAADSGISIATANALVAAGMALGLIWGLATEASALGTYVLAAVAAAARSPSTLMASPS